MEIEYDIEIKKVALQKDVFSLQMAEMEQRKIVLESKKRLGEAEAKIREYQTRISEKQNELTAMEG